MGLLNWLEEVRTEPDVVWVDGQFHVTASSTPAFAAKMSSGWWTGVLVVADGTLPPVPPTPMKHQGIAPVAFWPQPGQQIAVKVVPSDLTLIKFVWATSHADVGLAAAAELAKQLTE